jgi:hypothetical protein
VTDYCQWYIQTVDVWPYGQRHVAVRVPISRPSTEVAAVEVAEAEPIEVEVNAATTHTTDITIDAAVSIRSWLVRILARITITRRKP